MIINGVFVTTDVSPVSRKASTDNIGPARPALKPNTRIDIFNHAPRKAAPKRVNIDTITAKLGGIVKSMRSKPVADKPRPTAAAQRPFDLEYDPTHNMLAEMNKRNREYWHKG